MNAELDQLSTYGLLRHIGSNALHPLFQQLEQQGLLETSGGEYPLVSLTAKGAEFMRSGGPLRVKWPSIHSAKGGEGKGGKTRANEMAVATSELGFDDALFEKLKRLRNALAEAEDKQPYQIFSNQTLEFFTRLRPATIEAGLKIRGVGEYKAREYLPEFIRLIKGH